MKRAKVEILSQPGVSIQPAASSARERGMKVQQSGSPTILMSTSRVVEPSLTTRIFSDKAPVTEASLVQVSSSSSKEHSDYSGEEVDFGNDLLFLTPASFHTF